jgi:hypothetical protein
MRKLYGVSLPRIPSLRRAAAALVFASFLALSVGQFFHSGAISGARDVAAVTASSPALDAASFPHGGAHLPGLCSICRVIAQNRLGVRSPAIATAASIDALGVPLPLGTRHAAPRAPWLASIEPRAPPGALPVLSS